MTSLVPERLVASGLVAILLAPGLAAGARSEPASLSGLVLSTRDRSPIAQAKVFAADRATGTVFPSGPTDAAGRFQLGGLPAGRYEVAVALDRGLYPAPAAVALHAGQAGELTLAVDPEAESEPAAVPEAKPKDQRNPSLWANPLTAALLVLGAAIVVGVLVEGATDDEDELPASPFETR